MIVAGAAAVAVLLVGPSVASAATVVIKRETPFGQNASAQTQAKPS